MRQYSLTFIYFHDNLIIKHDNYYHGDSSGGESWCGKIVGVCITCCVGSIFFVAGIAFLISSIGKQNNLIETTGRITDSYPCGSSGNNGSRTYGSVIEYFDEINGETYTFSSDSCSSWRPTIGNSIKVLYDPDKPGEGFDASFVGMWLAPVLLLGAGSIVLCVFCGLLLRSFCCVGGSSNEEGVVTTHEDEFGANDPNALTPAEVYENTYANNTEEQAPDSSAPEYEKNNAQNEDSNGNGTSLFDRMKMGM